MNPHILYWKWNEDIFEEGVLERKTQDIIDRSMFNYIYISFHFTSDEHKILVSNELIQKIETVSNMLEENGRHLILDLDIRHEDLYYRQHSHQEHLYRIKAVSGTLDEQGSLRLEVPEGEQVLNCWLVDSLDNTEFTGDPMVITDGIYLENNSLTIQAGDAGTGKQVVCFISKQLQTYDLMGEEFITPRREMFERVKHIRICGVATDEWGIGPVKLDMPTIKPFKAKTKFALSEIKEAVDLGTIPMFVEWLLYSDGMERCYRQRYGKSLREEALYLWYHRKNDIQTSVRVINRYIENIRLSVVQTDRQFYDLGKEYFGENCFIACHPTWWGDELDNAFDCLRNGLDWWEARRDYAQTDELLPIPIRLGMMRKASENVWYNMWYSMRTMDIRTYYRETWINARFGGRTHHLGYECNEPNVVLELYPKGMLESLSAMEEKIEMINRQLDSRPDSRVLVLFGYENATNWKLSDPQALHISRRNPNMHRILSFTKELFDSPYLCELAPTTEIGNGSICMKDGAVTYMGHAYDAMVVIMGNWISESAYKLIEEYGNSGGNLLIVGRIDRLSDGTPVTMDFGNRGVFPADIETQTVAERLSQLGVPKMCGKNYCIYEDGTVLFTTDGKRYINNPLHVECRLGENTIQVDCLDYFICRKKGLL